MKYAKYIMATLLILFLFSGCKTSKHVSIARTETVATQVSNEQQNTFTKVDSTVQIKRVDTYSVVTEILYQTDSTGKTSPVKKTIKRNGVKTKLKTSEHTAVIAAEIKKSDSTAVKSEVYTKNKEVKRNSNMTGLVIAIIAVAIFFVIKMIRMK